MVALDRIGLIGVGLMGHGIARNLLKSGFPVTYLDHPGNQPVSDLLDMGAKPLQTCANVATHSDVVIICVTGSEQVEEVLTASQGVLDGLRPGSIVIDCSTIEPHVTTRLAQAVVEKGGQFLDAPMTRTPMEAEAGRLNVMVGGDAQTLAHVRPVLSAFCENIYHAGAIGTGHTLKLLHNFISLTNCILLAEAVVCARRCGIDLDVLIEVLSSGGGGSTALERLTPYLKHGDAAKFRFSLGNTRKDLAYYQSFAEHIDAPRELARAAARTMNDLVEAGNSIRPLPELIDILGTNKR